MSKYKRTIWIALAVVFVVVLFLLKTTSIFKNKETYEQTNQENGLSYGNLALENLVNKDTDNDGILDWEEGLWGTDPTKKETIPGTPDGAAIAKLKSEQTSATGTYGGNASVSEELSQTDQFSRELFATITSLNQNGAIDQITIDKLSDSLAEKIKNPAVKKVFLASELKITNDNSAEALMNYGKTLDAIYEKNKTKYTVLDVLQKFSEDENNVDTNILLKLDPIISQTIKMIEGMVKTPVPEDIADIHLDVINTLQGLIENMSDIKLYESDAIVAFSGIIKYGENAAKLEYDFSRLLNVIGQKIE